MEAGRKAWSKVSAVMCDKRIRKNEKKGEDKTAVRATVPFAFKTEAASLNIENLNIAYVGGQNPHNRLNIYR